RHPVIRTTVISRDGIPLQRVATRGELPLEVLDASGWPPEELEERLLAHVHHPFDLERGPLVRALLVTAPGQSPALVFCVHHIIGDLWSLVLLMEEVRTAYQERLAAKPIIWASLGVTYRDFVHWQQEMLRGPEGERQRAYWLRRLEGELPSLE